MTSRRFGVIFDLFGVVFSKGLESSIKHLEAVLGRSESEITPIYRKWEESFDLGLIDEREFWTRINAELKTNIDPKILSHIILSGYKLNEDTIKLAKRLGHAFTVIIYSNYRREWFDRLDSMFHVSKYFSQVYISSETGFLKPDPRAFSFVRDRLGIPITQLLLIDDLPSNVKWAEELGVMGVIFKSVYEAEVTVQHLTKHCLPYDEYYSGIILQTSQGALILQRRDDNPAIANPGMLSVFGGRRFQNEDSLGCAMRELKEETGLVYPKNEFDFVLELACPIENEQWMHCSFFIIRDVDVNQLDLKEGEYIEIWHPIELIHKPELTPVTKAVIQKLI